MQFFSCFMNQTWIIMNTLSAFLMCTSTAVCWRSVISFLHAHCVPTVSSTVAIVAVTSRSSVAWRVIVDLVTWHLNGVSFSHNIYVRYTVRLEHLKDFKLSFLLLFSSSNKITTCWLDCSPHSWKSLDLISTLLTEYSLAIWYFYTRLTMPQIETSSRK